MFQRALRNGLIGSGDSHTLEVGIQKPDEIVSWSSGFGLIRPGSSIEKTSGRITDLTRWASTKLLPVPLRPDLR